MNRITYTVSAFLLALAMMAAPVMDAQTRGRAGRNTTSQGAYAPNTSGNGSSSANGTRPGNGNNGNHNNNNNNTGNSRPGNNNGGGWNRPGNGSGNHNGWNRPDNNNHNRPGNGNNHGNNGNHNGGWNRPGNGNHNNNHGNNHGNSGNHNGWNRPGNGNHWNHNGGNSHWNRPGHNDHRGPWNHGHDYCHHVPFFNHYHRPVAPHRWHYSGGGPTFGTILGITLGSAIGASLDMLIHNGYNVASYGNNVVYLNNVPQMNFIWPDAALYYNNGRLYGSQFTYASPYMDMSRFNHLYNTFNMQYGLPVQSVNQGGNISATWYGAGGRYVTLSYNSNYSGTFYTTLSFGN